jgi:hypothetical protein
MADQKHALTPAAAAVGRDQVARAARLGHRHPPDFESERLELRPDHAPDRFDAREVQGPAILVDHPLEELERSSLLFFDGSDHPLLGGAELRLRAGGSEGEGENEEGKEGLHRGRS